MNENRICKTCGISKPLGEFPLGKGNVEGRRPSCKPCYSKYSYATRNKIVCARAQTKYLRSPYGRKKRQEVDRKNAPKRYIATKAWRARMKAEGKSSEIYLRHSLKSCHKLTLERYKEMLAAQNGACAICHQLNQKRRLSVDHDHNCCPGNRSCGKCIRALLCGSCNVGLGNFKESPVALQSAISYLSRYKQG